MTTGLPAKLCDMCHRPGACCRDFVLSVPFLNDQPIELEWRAFVERMEPRSGPLMQFVPTRRHVCLDPANEIPGNSYWRFKCTALRPNGRCGIYENRPSPCRTYAAGSDNLCVMYAGPPRSPYP